MANAGKRSNRKNNPTAFAFNRRDEAVATDFKSFKPEPTLLPSTEYARVPSLGADTLVQDSYYFIHNGLENEALVPVNYRTTEYARFILSERSISKLNQCNRDTHRIVYKMKELIREAQPLAIFFNQANMKTKTCLLVTLLGILGMMSVATAQTTNIILGTDFDGFGDYNYGYAFAYAGSELGKTAVAPPNTYEVVSSAGVDNTAAARATVDYTGLATDPNYQNATSYTYAGVALHLVFTPTLANITPVATLNTLTLSCDVNVQGLLPGLTNTDVILNSLQFGTNGAPITTAVASFTGESALRAPTTFISTFHCPRWR